MRIGSYDNTTHKYSMNNGNIKKVPRHLNCHVNYISSVCNYNVPLYMYIATVLIVLCCIFFAVSIVDVTVIISPNLTLYQDTSVNIACNVTLSNSVDTSTTITYQWLGGTTLLTDGSDYTITDNTLSINQLMVARDNGRTITCIATVTVSSLYVVQNTANDSTQLTVVGEY